MSFNRNLQLNRLDGLGGQIDQAASDFQFDWKMTIATSPLMLTANYILWTLKGGFVMANLLSSKPKLEIY